MALTEKIVAELTYLRQTGMYTNYLRGQAAFQDKIPNDSGEIGFYLKMAGKVPYVPADHTSPFPNDAIHRDASGPKIARETISFYQGDA